jgi:hypothetical protein
MSDTLRERYEGTGTLDRYYDGKSPIDLFRGRRMGDSTDLMQPTLIGWHTRRGPRPPDVLVEGEVDGVSPQYNQDRSGLVTEDRSKPLTQEIVRNADKYIVKDAGP